MASFEAVVEEYDAGRPQHPEALYDALEPLAGRLVVEGGAGTGIATRALKRRGARMIAFDRGRVVLGRAVHHDPGLAAVVADGAAAPFRSGCADLVCYAQAWHWITPGRRVEEAARLLRPGGRWAAWWSHPRAEGQAWFDGLWDLLERRTAASRAHREIDWGVELQANDAFVVGPQPRFRWQRTVSIHDWLTDERSKSYVAALEPDDREDLIREVDGLLRAAFPSATMQVPYDTRLWTAVRTIAPSTPG